jgi:hypothetical protein
VSAIVPPFDESHFGPGQEAVQQLKREQLKRDLNARITTIPQALEPRCGGTAASKRFVDLQARQTRWAASLTALCIALFLVATTAQAAHFCGFRVPNTHGGSQVASSGTTVCLTCLIASSATAIVVFVAFFPSLRTGVRISCQPAQPRPFRGSLQLYVRPPPAY